MIGRACAKPIMRMRKTERKGTTSMTIICTSVLISRPYLPACVVTTKPHKPPVMAGLHHALSNALDKPLYHVKPIIG